MRKKSAFLERLTARAAAAFEAGGSYGAYESEARTDVHSPALDASMPSGAASLHEPSMRYSAQADAQSTQALPHGNMGIAKSSAELHTEQSAELGTQLHIQDNTQQSPELRTEQASEQSSNVHTELNTEVHTEQGAHQRIQESTQLSTEPNTELHNQEGAETHVDPVAPVATVASMDSLESTAVGHVQDNLQENIQNDVQQEAHDASSPLNPQFEQTEQVGQHGMPNMVHEYAIESESVEHSLDTGQELADHQIDAERNAELGTEQSTQVHTEQHRHDIKPIIPPTMPLSIDSDEERICASLGDVAKVLFAHLIAMEKNVLNMKRLHLYNQHNLPIPYTSIRTAWTRLKTLRIISHSARHDIGKEKGVLFQLDGVYTFAFQKLYPHMLVRVRAGQNVQNTIGQSTEFHTGLNTQLGTEQSTQSSAQQNIQLHTELGAQINPQLSTQLHAQVAPVTEIPKPKTKLEAHPEYVFWRDCGLTQTQCMRWKEEFGLDDLLLDNYLRWCAHDVGHDERKDKSGKSISNPANWFYTIMKKAGAYPKPEGYQSHEEKIFFVRENLLKEQAALHARQNDLRAQEERQEAEALFAAFLEEGESAQQFHELCAKISPFLYENRHTRRRLFENALRTEYFAFLGIDAGHKD